MNRDPVGNLSSTATEREVGILLRDATPDRLRLFLLLTALSAILFSLVATTTIQQHKDAARTVGYDAGPSVIAAHEIKNALVRMGNELANELLRPASPGSAVGGDWSSQDYEKWRVVAGKQIIGAASNITYGLSEQEPLEQIQMGLGRFESMAQQALDYRQDKKLDESMNSYRLARETLDKQIVPATERLDRANRDQLESIYAREESASALLSGFTLVTGLVLIGVLIVTQIYLASRFRRRINLPIFLVTLATLALVQQLYTTLREDANQLKVAKGDAYDSIIALLDARSDVYQANAAVSHWLLTGSSEEKACYTEKLKNVVSFEGISPHETYALAAKKLAASEPVQIKGFTGSLANELNNIRFEGEDREALEALQNLNDYMQIEERVLAASEPSQSEACELALGFYPNQSQYAFSKFDDAVSHAVKINEEHFAASIRNALRKLNGLVVIVQVFTVLVLFCVFLGLRPRLAEYGR